MRWCRSSTSRYACPTWPLADAITSNACSASSWSLTTVTAALFVAFGRREVGIEHLRQILARA